MAERHDALWSESAVSDLDEILEYLAEEASIDRALELYEQVRRRVASLSQWPRRCRYVPELKELGLTEFRESILAPYRLFFRLAGDHVVLLGILDSRRDLEELLIQRALEPGDF